MPADIPITNGNQLLDGSCNPAPMGQIPSTQNLPSVRISLDNGATFAVNTSIPFSLFVSNLQSGVFVNSDENYLSAPQQLNSTTGNVLGHYHVVVDELDALNTTLPTDSRDFVFFNILGDAADSNGQIQSSITKGLPEGFYRFSATVNAANYQPVLVPISQHGSLNDVVYVRFGSFFNCPLLIHPYPKFTVTADGTPGSTPAVKRRASIPEMRHRYQRNPSALVRRTVISRDDTGAQTSLTLLPSVIASGFAKDGQDTEVSGEILAFPLTSLSY